MYDTTAQIDDIDQLLVNGAFTSTANFVNLVDVGRERARCFKAPGTKRTKRPQTYY